MAKIVKQYTILYQGAAKQYTFRHNEVRKYSHWWILKDQGIPVPDMWHKHVPVDTMTCKNIEIFWDKTIMTDKKINYNRPDITIHDTKNRECIFIDVAVPACSNIIQKEAGRITKYRI